jgi:hypothetical protein
MMLCDNCKDFECNGCIGHMGEPVAYDVDIRNIVYSFPTLRGYILECYRSDNMDQLWHLLECLETDRRSC